MMRVAIKLQLPSSITTGFGRRLQRRDVYAEFLEAAAEPPSRPSAAAPAAPLGAPAAPSEKYCKFDAVSELMLAASRTRTAERGRQGSYLDSI